jgi:probable F420-dependent oxidoreductase
MQVGVVFPQAEIGDDPGIIRDFAQTAEELGFSHILAYDHVLGAVHAGRVPPLTVPHTEETVFHEPFVLFAYLAGVTRRIGFTSGVLILPQRQTALVAKQAAELQILSGGRLRLGVGIGWNYVEYESLGIPYRDRGKREEEQVQLLRRLWNEQVVDFSGRFHRVDRAGLRPLPQQPIPIWFGGYAEALLDRTARVGDGLIGGGPAIGAEIIAHVRSLAASYGRNPAALGFDAQLRYERGPDRWQADTQRWQQAGGTHASLNTMGQGLLSPRAHLDALRRYAEAAAFSH